MTKEEAIERLKTDIYKYADFTENPNENEFWMAFDMAIETLEQQTCKDAVSREAVLGLFAQNADATRPYNKTWEEVKALPSVKPQYTDDEIQKMQKLEQAEIQKAYEIGKTDVLDKIRAEIEQITDTMGVSYNQYVSKIDVLQIIDKYKAEKEVQDAVSD